MLRLTLKDDDVVLVCMPVDQAVVVVRGSVVISCDECGRQCWRAPDKPLFQKKASGLVPATFVPDPTVLLCLPCGIMHERLNPDHD